MKKRKSKEKVHILRTSQRWVLFMVCFSLIGGIWLLVASHAVSPFASSEAETGALNGTTSTINDSNASGGIAVKFGATSQITLPNPGTWTNVTNNLANMPSECGNLTTLSSVPNANEVIAGIAQQGLWATTNDGASWFYWRNQAIC